jgi:hypothetical protein
MKLLRATLIALSFISLADSLAVAETVVSREESLHNRDVVLKYLLPAFKSSASGGRIYYAATCEPTDRLVPFRFPQIRVETPTTSGVALRTIRQMFRNDPTVKVTRNRSGLIAIAIGDVDDAILKTRIGRVNFSPDDQYTPETAVHAISDSPEIRDAERKLGFDQFLPDEDVLLGSPGTGGPHLPPFIENMTLGDALDLVAKTFHGVVLYAACSRQRMFVVDFGGGEDFDPNP